MQNKKKFVRQEKGAISTLVLFTVLVFLVILMGSYLITTTLLKSQLKSNLRIQQIYGQEVDNVDQIYEELITNSFTIDNLVGKEASNKNQETKDKYGNKVVIPAGFAIVTPEIDSTVDYGNDENGNKKQVPTVQDGIVIKDKDGNEFVWIPVGEINDKDGKITTIILGRYTFSNGGTSSTPNTNGAELKTKADAEYEFLEETISNKSNKGNTIAKDIEAFIKSVNENHGYYIARYEASYNDNTKPYSKQSIGTPTSQNGIVPTKKNQLWNNITQPAAAIVAKNMYSSDIFESDLVNSYAWDTAIVFIQKYSGNNNYANEISKNTTDNGGLDNTGERTNTTDKVSNIYDMASNCLEWTTETCTKNEYPCVIRGGRYDVNYENCSTSYRYYGKTENAYNYISFRVILYID